MIHHDSWLDKSYSTPLFIQMAWTLRAELSRPRCKEPRPLDRSEERQPLLSCLAFSHPNQLWEDKALQCKDQGAKIPTSKMLAGSFQKYDLRWWLCVVNWIFQLRCGQKIPLPCRFGIGSEWSDIGRLANGRFPPRIGRRVIRARSAKARECTFAYTMCMLHTLWLYNIYIYMNKRCTVVCNSMHIMYIYIYTYIQWSMCNEPASEKSPPTRYNGIC